MSGARALLAVAVAVCCLLVAAAPAASAAPAPLGLSCSAAADGSLQCGSDSFTSPTPSLADTWDGMPIDVSVALPDPSAPTAGAPYPLVMMFHGYGQGKVPFSQMKHYTDRGYAVFTMTDRGFYNSCGNSATSSDPACDGQYVRLMDDRYEVRDAQYFAGELVDEGIALPHRIAATGLSYGAGTSMALAALKDRTMLQDGRLVPWTSPGGTPMSLAVATPFAPWTDLAYSLAPNGRVLDYLRDNPYDPRHFGVMKQSIENGLYLSGAAAGRYAPVGEIPSADVTGWRDLMDGGEPYEGDIAATRMLSEITTYHSSYYIDHGRPPAPTLIADGFTDDIFPVDEALRYYNRTKAQHPGADIGLIFADYGHQRAQNKARVLTAYAQLQDRWFDHYLAGDGAKPADDVVAYTETCPQAAPDGGPYTASDWASIAPGEITIEGGADQTIEPGGGSPGVAAAFGVLGDGACATASGAREPGTANYDSGRAPAGGFTLLGSPTVIADFEGAGSASEIAARLVDVAPDGTERLVARQLYRPDASGYQVFQLHPGAWRFGAGHIARLQLLPKDATAPAAPNNLTNYGRPSDRQRRITVHDLVLRLPVTERPGALGGLVKPPAKKVLPGDGRPVALAPGYAKIGSETMAQWVRSRPVAPPPPTPPPVTPHRDRVSVLPVAGGAVRAGRKRVRLRISCPAAADSCVPAQVLIRAHRKKGRRGARRLIAIKQDVSLAPGTRRRISIGMTGAARRLIHGRKVARRRHGRAVTRHRRGIRHFPVKVRISGTAGRSATGLRLSRKHHRHRR